MTRQSQDIAALQVARAFAAAAAAAVWLDRALDLT